jgi:protein gp37
MSDLFHDGVPDEYIIKVFAVMYLCGRHTFQVLTKRAERLPKFFTIPDLQEKIDLAAFEIMDQYEGHIKQSRVYNLPLPNVWIGVSVEDQQTANERIERLSWADASVRFISMEPMLGPIDLYMAEGFGMLDWIIVGGESGHKRRPFDPEWARNIRDFCREHDIAFFMKQIDKKLQIPEDLMIREFPKHDLRT